MTEPSHDAALIAEFDAFAARAQLPVPPDRREALIAGYGELREMLALLRQPLPPSAEPAGTFDPSSVTRGL